MTEPAPADVLDLQDVIADASMRGIGNGTYSMARAILEAGYRRAPAAEADASEHVYLSTACLHGQHEHCRSAVAADGGAKKPGTCKFCGAVCVCPVCDHGAESGMRAHLDSRQPPA